MHNIAKIYEKRVFEKYLGPGRVIKADCPGGMLQIKLTGREHQPEITARPLVSFSPLPSTGDSVLVMEDGTGDFFVIGILTRAASDFFQDRLQTADGAFAAIVRSEKGETLNVYSESNALLFEYDPMSKKARLFSESENVAFEAPGGDIEIAAAGSIRLKGHHVEVSGTSGIDFSVGKMVETLKTALTLLPGKMDVSAQEIKISARRASLFLDEARNIFKSAFYKIGTVKLLADKMETTASTLVEKTKNTYRTMENLNQVKAGRMRVLVHKAFHLKSKSSVIKAEDDVKIKGEKIHLG